MNEAMMRSQLIEGLTRSQDRDKGRRLVLSPAVGGWRVGYACPPGDEGFPIAQGRWLVLDWITTGEFPRTIRQWPSLDQAAAVAVDLQRAALASVPGALCEVVVEASRIGGSAQRRREPGAMADRKSVV